VTSPKCLNFHLFILLTKCTKFITKLRNIPSKAVASPGTLSEKLRSAPFPYYLTKVTIIRRLTHPHCHSCFVHCIVIYTRDRYSVIPRTSVHHIFNHISRTTSNYAPVHAINHLHHVYSHCISIFVIILVDAIDVAGHIEV